MITRTVVGTKIEAKVVSKTTNEVSTINAVVSKAVADEKVATRELSKVIDSDLVIINIVSFTKVENLYGMSIADFMANAVELDPVTRKPVTTDEN